MKMSKSKINSFLHCRRQFKYQYIDKIPQKESDAMLLGTDVHEIAEQFIKTGGIHSKDYSKTIQSLAKKQNSKYDIQVHLKNLTKFFEDVFHQTDMKYEVFSCEDYLYDEKHNFSGLADLVVRDENNDVIIIDYKTGRSGSIKKYRLELCYYRMLLESKYPNIDIIAAGIFFTKDGKYRFLNFVETQEKGAYCTDNAYHAALDLIDFVRNEINHNRLQPKQQYLCKYCSYLSQCQNDGGF